ncbi:MAG: LamG-like jellyroll fold domain-containing protein [Spirochaetota bacterium]
MRLKGIGAVALVMLAAIPVRALEERIILAPGLPSLLDSNNPGAAVKARAPSFGDWTSDGAVLRKGFRGAPEYVLANQAYRADADTDLLLHFDEASFREETGEWTVLPGKNAAVDRERSLLGPASGSFRGPSSELTLNPGPRALLARDSRFRDFSIEFWLYPANAENGEILLLWQSLRKVGKETRSQELSCVISAGRIAWSFGGFFVPPDSLAKLARAPVELAARTALIPRSWTHHLLRFDGDSGLLEYLVDGVPEAMTYVTSTGREGGTVFEPAIGGASPLRLGADFAGLIDEFRVSRSFVTSPNLKPYGRDPALILSPVADLGYAHSRLTSIDVEARSPGTTGIELSYRIADEASAWRLDEPAWIPLRAGQPLPESPRGRYVQVRVELYADGSRSLSPALSSLSLHFEPDPPPPPPARLVATVKNGAIELRWTRVPVADLGGYLIYYGESPGEYFGSGALEGRSPVDAGQNLSFTLTGLQNGRLYYFVVASYDSAGLAQAGGNPPSRAGEFSTEIAARPSRTAP